VLQRSPLQRNVDQGDVGKAAAYLLDAENVTGTVAYVDAGYHAMGL
jgi:enoyl-[acyl-carrier protein] reductase I